jgi:hypothetical protein
MDTGVARLTAILDAAGDRHPEFGLLTARFAARADPGTVPPDPDDPDGPGPAFLLVALRPVPTMRHYDPEAVDYWASSDGRDERRILSNETPMPRSDDYSWGLIRLVDRLGTSNEYLTFGGHFDAACIDDVVVAVFASPAPLLRRGGNTQGRDPGADAAGAFFARMMVAVESDPGFGTMLRDATPMTRYSAFVRDAERRRRTTRHPAAVDDDLRRRLRREAARLRTTDAEHWEAAGAFLHAGVPE